MLRWCPGLARPGRSKQRERLHRILGGSFSKGNQRVGMPGGCYLFQNLGMVSNVVIVFLKYPEPGQVKTRLAASVGDKKAAEIYGELVAMTLAALPWSKAHIEIHFSPPTVEQKVKQWLAPVIPAGMRPSFVAQSHGDLGQRLNGAIERAFRFGPKIVTVVGTDCPHLTLEHFHSAWTALDRCDAVFGPAHDGGYYLLALKTRAPYLFQGIPWSSDTTLSESLKAADRANLTTSLLEPLHDIDTVADLADFPWMTH